MSRPQGAVAFFPEAVAFFPVAVASLAVAVASLAVAEASGVAVRRGVGDEDFSIWGRQTAHCRGHTRGRDEDQW